jgi:hypothetical protein
MMDSATTMTVECHSPTTRIQTAGSRQIRQRWDGSRIRHNEAMTTANCKARLPHTSRLQSRAGRIKTDKARMDKARMDKARTITLEWRSPTTRIQDASRIRRKLAMATDNSKARLPLISRLQSRRCRIPSAMQDRRHSARIL